MRSYAISAHHRPQILQPPSPPTLHATTNPQPPTPEHPPTLLLPPAITGGRGAAGRETGSGDGGRGDGRNRSGRRHCRARMAGRGRGAQARGRPRSFRPLLGWARTRAVNSSAVAEPPGQALRPPPIAIRDAAAAAVADCPSKRRRSERATPSCGGREGGRCSPVLGLSHRICDRYPAARAAVPGVDARGAAAGSVGRRAAGFESGRRTQGRRELRRFACRENGGRPLPLAPRPHLLHPGGGQELSCA